MRRITLSRRRSSRRRGQGKQGWSDNVSIFFFFLSPLKAGQRVEKGTINQHTSHIGPGGRQPVLGIEHDSSIAMK